MTVECRIIFFSEHRYKIFTFILRCDGLISIIKFVGHTNEIGIKFMITCLRNSNLLLFRPIYYYLLIRWRFFISATIKKNFHKKCSSNENDCFFFLLVKYGSYYKRHMGQTQAEGILIDSFSFYLHISFLSL
jgi:hypothetical protein